MPIRQADAPNHCSIANKAVYETCMVLAKLTMPFGCFATLRSLSHCLQLIRHSSRQLLCPSCHLIHFVLRSATLHLVRSLPFAARHGTPSNTQSKSTMMHIPFHKPRYNTHWVPFRSTMSYIHLGRIQSTRCR